MVSSGTQHPFIFSPFTGKINFSHGCRTEVPIFLLVHWGPFSATRGFLQFLATWQFSAWMFDFLQASRSAPVWFPLLQLARENTVCKVFTWLSHAHLDNLPSSRSTDLGPYLNLENPLIAVPRFVLDRMSGRRCMYTRPRKLEAILEFCLPQPWSRGSIIAQFLIKMIVRQVTPTA